MVPLAEAQLTTSKVVQIAQDLKHKEKLKIKN